MDHADHVALLREGIEGGGRTWADLGSGTGAFTLALADLLGPGGVIHSVDRDRTALRIQAEAMARRFPSVRLYLLERDFTTPLALPPLDGVVMANSLHFARDKAPILALVRGYLREGGRLVLVEYGADRGNPWVPHPLSFATWRVVANAAGFVGTRQLGSVPSRFLGSIYSAVSVRS
jgi:SAM-dependent methyltransferase